MRRRCAEKRKKTACQTRDGGGGQGPHLQEQDFVLLTAEWRGFFLCLGKYRRHAKALRRMLARTSRGLSRSAQMLRTHARGIAVGDKFPNVEVRSGAHSPFCLLEHTPDNRAHVQPRACAATLAPGGRCVVAADCVEPERPHQGQEGDPCGPARCVHANLIQGPGASLSRMHCLASPQRPP